MPERSHLVRDLRVHQAGSVVVGTVIGSGIFLVPSEMIQAVGEPAIVYLVWVVGGVLSLFGALTYAELGAMKPEAGGEYIYIRDAYGPLAGFLYAWSWFIIAKPGTIATISAGMMRVLGTFPALSFLGQRATEWPFAITWAQVMAVPVVVLISYINYRGVRKAGDFQFWFTLFKIAIILGIIVIAFSYSGGTWSNFSTQHPGARGGMAGFFIALVAALWAYDGWNNLNMVSGEISHPERNIPIALIGGVGVLAALYMTLNAAVQYVMPASAMAATGRPASEAVLIVLGAGAAAVASGAIALQMMATLNGTIMSGARIPFAVARDGYFFQRLADVHPRFHTPHWALAFQAGLGIIFLMFVGRFDWLFSITIFAEWLFYMLGTSTVFIFRRREPDLPRPYRTWGYPIVPALFVAAAAVLLFYTYVENLQRRFIPTDLIGPPVNSLAVAGTLVILAGVPVFYYFARSRNPW
jgi:APA family basic amino acid/polyamine antiporter